MPLRSRRFHDRPVFWLRNADEIARDRWPGLEADHNEQAADLTDITYVFDNSGHGGTATHSFVMKLDEGRIVTPPNDPVPRWVRAAYARQLAEL